MAGVGVAAVVDLGPGDLPALLALYRDLHADDDPLPEAGEVRARFASLLDMPGASVLGMRDGDALVGSLVLVIVPNLTRGARPFAVIENVVTRADRRGEGVGRALLHEAEARARRAACYKVMLASAAHRNASHGFYERLGWDGDAKRCFVLDLR